MAIRTIKRLKPELWSKAIEAARQVFPPNNQYGVFAFSIGPKIKQGVSLGYATLNVFIERKMNDPKDAIPSIKLLDSKGELQVIPDVIATGSHPRLGYSTGISYNGLHPGSVIKIMIEDVDFIQYGGVACILSKGYDPTHILTAGHLFPKDAVGTPVYAGFDEEVKCGELIINLLDSNYDTHIDAALIELTTEDDITLVGESLGYGPELDHIETLSPGQKIKGRAFLPTSNYYSEDTQINYLPNIAYFDSEIRGEESLLITD